jgi:hypothetical protein
LLVWVLENEKVGVLYLRFFGRIKSDCDGQHGMVGLTAYYCLGGDYRDSWIPLQKADMKKEPSQPPDPTQTMKLITAAIALFLVCMCVTIRASSGYNTGQPFGEVGDAEMNQLQAYGKSQGVDLIGDMKRAYQKDDAALARVFCFSLKFDKLDPNARAYGQIIYSSFLNLAEVMGVDRYSSLVAAQPKAIRQRIRDFIYFDVTQAPKEIRQQVEAGARESAPALFPKNYVFGEDDALFKKG